MKSSNIKWYKNMWGSDQPNIQTQMHELENWLEMKDKKSEWYWK